jgi:hypothetical protein
VVCYCKHGNELSGSIKWWEFLESLNSCRLPKKNFAPFGELVMAIKQTIMQWTVHLTPAGSSEASIIVYQSTRRQIVEDGTDHNHLRDNQKSCFSFICNALLLRQLLRHICVAQCL